MNWSTVKAVFCLILLIGMVNKGKRSQLWQIHCHIYVQIGTSACVCVCVKQIAREPKWPTTVAQRLRRSDATNAVPVLASEWTYSRSQRLQLQLFVVFICVGSLFGLFLTASTKNKALFLQIRHSALTASEPNILCTSVLLERIGKCICLSIYLNRYIQ